MTETTTLTRDAILAALRELPAAGAGEHASVAGLLADARVEPGDVAVLVLRAGDAATLPQGVAGEVDAALRTAGFADVRVESEAARPMPPVSKAPTDLDVEEALKDVVDPELGINVVDLGLVYGVHLDEDHVATIDMTLTSAACPLTDEIEDQATEALKGVVSDFRINWVWMPPWGPEHITEDGREQLRALGFSI